MKKFFAIILVLILILSLSACSFKTLHCDHCGKEIKVTENNQMEEDWIIYCEECNKKLFGDDPLLGTGSN